MSKIETLVTMLAFAEENNDTEEVEKIVKAIEEIQGKQAGKFFRDRPQIMDAMERQRRNMMILH